MIFKVIALLMSRTLRFNAGRAWVIEHPKNKTNPAL